MATQTTATATTDFELQRAGGLLILYPRTDAAKEWVADHISDEATRWCGGVVIEHRYMDDVYHGILGDDLTIQGIE